MFTKLFTSKKSWKRTYNFCEGVDKNWLFSDKQVGGGGVYALLTCLQITFFQNYAFPKFVHTY